VEGSVWYVTAKLITNKSPCCFLISFMKVHHPNMILFFFFIRILEHELCINW
jgi:hypothetical protein